MKKSTAYPTILLALFLGAYLLIGVLGEDEAATHRAWLHGQHEEPVEPVAHGVLKTGASAREVVNPSDAVETAVEASSAQAGSLSVSALYGEGRHVERVRVILRHPKQSFDKQSGDLFFNGSELADHPRLTPTTRHPNDPSSNGTEGPLGMLS